MHDHVIALGEDALDLALVVREFLLEEADKALDAIEPVGADRVVLDIGGADIFRGLVEILLVQHRNVEFDHVLLVALHLGGIGHLRLRRWSRERKDNECNSGNPFRDHDVFSRMRAAMPADSYRQRLSAGRESVNSAQAAKYLPNGARTARRWANET
jgi:hypothetical protein